MHAPTDSADATVAPPSPAPLAALPIVVALVIGGLAALFACAPGSPAPSATTPPTLDAAYDPLAFAAARAGAVANLEASIPPLCYTRTGGVSNPCWACHTAPLAPNQLEDADLQEAYAFSDVGLENHWTNLFVDRRPAIAATSEADALAWIRTDNYAALRTALAARTGYPGWVPDLDFAAGFDADGFARDGSGWRALRYTPFLGTFWPTNGSSDDVFVRLPRPFRTDAAGAPSPALERVNYAILEAAIAGDPRQADRDVVRAVGPVDETVAGLDLDGDGRVGGIVTTVRGLPARYVGGADGVAVRRRLFPEGVAFLHTVRYVDPDAPDLRSARMKEVRYMVKADDPDAWARNRAAEKELAEKEEGRVPVFRGAADVGLGNAFGWRLQGFIEAADGRLRLQTDEETRFCMGCHTSIGVTVDSTFSFARKVPGPDGWRTQDLRGLVDHPQVGHAEPEALTYFRRVRGGDELRANDELLARFFPGGVLAEAEVRRAARGGDRDLAWLLTPSRARALALAKAYLAVVREQSFVLGRDAVLAPATRVHPRIEGNGETELGAAGLVFTDGTLFLDHAR